MQSKGKLIILVLILSILQGSVLPCFAAQAAGDEIVSGSATAVEAENISIVDYLSDISSKNYPNEQIIISIDDSIELSEGKSATFEFDVAQEGIYGLEMTYTVLQCLGQYPSITVKINDKIPYREANIIELMRRWQSEDYGDKILTNTEMPEQSELQTPITTFLRDTAKYYGDILLFDLKKGVNTLTIIQNSEHIQIDAIAFKNSEEEISFKKANINKDKLYKGEPLYIEGEKAKFKSDASLFPINDSSSASVNPSSPYDKYLNTIGGTNWKNNGQYIEWEINVPEDGLYKMAFKYRQNINVGMSSFRSLSIDGKIPYEECAEIGFAYSSTYKNLVLSTDGKELLFNLKKGTHTIRLEVVIGPLKEILPSVEEVIMNLNTAYRQVIVITGSNPDSLRDYRLEDKVPETIKLLDEQRKKLLNVKSEIEKISGGGSQGSKILGTLCEQLKKFVWDPFIMTGQLGDFKSNISSLSNWLLDAKNQPLSIDYFALYGDTKIKNSEKGFLHSLKFNFLSFLYTFSDDYNYKSDDRQTLTVWTNGNTTAYSILKQIVDSKFKNDKSEFKVDVKLVEASLITAIIAGKAPDVSLGISDGDIMNLAYRNSAVDISKFEDFPKMVKKFRDSALTPVTFENSVYGLPLTQTFQVLYYRTDVLEEMGIKVPNDWNDVISAMAALKKKNLEFGIPSDISSFVTLLLQRGGNLYNNELTASAVTSHDAIEAFTDFCAWFTDYKSPIAYDASQRFRTGEMPLLIADYGFCNQIEVAAPEIKGMWEMTLLPGTVNENGEINRSGQSISTYAVVLNEEKAEMAWEFIKWLDSADIQYDIAQKQEMAIGQSVRVNIANLEAFERLGYTNKAKAIIKEQGEQSIGIPNVPGGYYVSRYLSNALNKVLYQNEIPGDALYSFAKTIDEEITYKRHEFNLD